MALNRVTANDLADRPGTMRLRTGEHAIYCEHGAAAVPHGPPPALLGRGILERPENGIDSSLVAPALRLEPLEYVGVHSQRYRGLGTAIYRSAYASTLAPSP